jgi:hypothetical protein
MWILNWKDVIRIYPLILFETIKIKLSLKKMEG